METLMFIAQHKDENHGRSQHFRETSCSTFQFGVGILPTPKTSSKLTLNDQNLRQSERIVKCSSVPIQINGKHVDHSVKTNIGGFIDEFFYSELWAGPAYSNSPPPSSLPIPNFPFKPKRTVSLDIPSPSESDDVDLLSLLTKSAPASPTGTCQECFEMEFPDGGDYDSATNTLRRILNLDMVETDQQW